jgi:hypothetical protein
LPVEKPKPEIFDPETGLLKQVLGIREVYRYASTAERAKRLSTYAWYFDSKEATEVPPPVEKPSKDETEGFDPKTGLPEYPGIN